MIAQCAAQPSPSTRGISGTIQDKSDAYIPGARITIVGANGRTIAQSKSDPVGGFSFPTLSAGTYTVVVMRNGFQETRQQVSISAQFHGQLHIVMEVAGASEDVVVTASDNSAQLSTEISQNQSGNAVDRDALDRLPVFDQDYITTMSRFLDADSTGTNGVTLVVNGVEANGPGVTASAIQSVKINQNPYTALYSRPGRARIEITTKGGTPQLHGAANFLYRNSIFDATNAFAATKPSESRIYSEGSITGPLSHDKKTTFLLAFDDDHNNQQAIVVAAVPGGAINENVSNPTHHYFISGRVFHDFREGKQLWIGYSYEHRSVENQGVGGTVLPEAGTNTSLLEHEISVNYDVTLSPKLLNQLHFLVGHNDNRVQSLNNNPLLMVSGAFTGGGAQADMLRTESHFDGTDIVTYSTGKQEIKFGVDVPDISRRGFDDFTNRQGSYSFANLASYMSAQPYTFLGQSGQGHVAFLEKTLAGIFEDNVRLKSNLSISFGVRYYWQNYFHNVPYNFGPRIGFAYAPTSAGKTILRGGAGFFFDRSGPSPISDLLHFDGVTLKRFIVNSPTYPITPGQLEGVPTSVVVLDPRQRIPYTIQYGFGIERQLNAKSSFFANYIGTRGIDLFRSIDSNAPPPPNYLMRPNMNLGQERQIQSEGYLKSNSLEIGLRGSPVNFFNGQVRYNLGKTYTNTSGITYFPSNSYFPSADWSRSDNDQRHRFDLLGVFKAKEWFSFGTALSAYSGKPVNITTGSDDYNNGMSNARPQGVPRNSMHGPGYLSLDLNATHDFALSDSGQKGPVATISISSFNVLNRANDLSYIGVVGSPFFAHAVAAQPPRRMQVTLQLKF